MKRLLPLFLILVILLRRPEWHPPTSHSPVISRSRAIRLTSILILDYPPSLTF